MRNSIRWGPSMEFLTPRSSFLMAFPSTQPSPPHYIPRAHDTGESQIAASDTS